MGPHLPLQLERRKHFNESRPKTRVTLPAIAHISKEPNVTIALVRKRGHVPHSSPGPTRTKCPDGINVNRRPASHHRQQQPHPQTPPMSVPPLTRRPWGPQSQAPGYTDPGAPGKRASCDPMRVPPRSYSRSASAKRCVATLVKRRWSFLLRFEAESAMPMGSYYVYEEPGMDFVMSCPPSRSVGRR